MTRTRALLSVSDKTGIVELARALAGADVELVSTGGTAALLREHGIEVIDVAQVTGQPEVMGGRVKTLHPRVHGGLLARRDVPADIEALAELGGAPIDWMVVNLYPFRQTIARPDVRPDDAIEQIDIGGPSMIRAAAKNHADVTVVVDPADYAAVAAVASAGQSVDLGTRRELAAKAFRHVASYDAVIAEYLTGLTSCAGDYPEQLTITLDKVHDLRYGENPHQSAAFYALPTGAHGTLVDAEQHQGKELSYNNIADTDAALTLLAEFRDTPAAVIVKHVNPCGVATGATIHDAWEQALAADPVSAFGGIVALNRTVDKAVAIGLHDIFLEVVVAPSFTSDALELLSDKPNLRVLELDLATGGASSERAVASTVSGGMLLQAPDAVRTAQLQVVAQQQPTEQQLADLRFAWNVVKHVTSNAIVLAVDGRTLGIGAGQMNRVGAARIALAAAGAGAAGSALASDAFFPMADSIELAAAAGVTSIIQPGGSVRDDEVIAACDRAGIAMVFTGTRHFRH